MGSRNSPNATVYVCGELTNVDECVLLTIMDTCEGYELYPDHEYINCLIYRIGKDHLIISLVYLSLHSKKFYNLLIVHACTVMYSTIITVIIYVHDS